MLVSTIVVFVSTFLSFTYGSVHAHRRRSSHQDLAQRARGDVNIHKRSFDNARFTFYAVGLGACGQYNSPGDFIVALNVDQFGDGYPGPYCFQSITITYGGKTAQATIMDECMGCPYGGLDFSTGLFDYFASADAGVIYGSWSFNDGSSQPTTSSSPAWTPTPTPTPTPTSSTTTYQATTSSTPTTSYSTPSTTSTSTTSTSSASSSTSASTTMSSSSSVNSSTGSGIAVPTGTPTVGTPGSGNLFVINEALVKFGILLTAQH